LSSTTRRRRPTVRSPLTVSCHNPTGSDTHPQVAVLIHPRASQRHTSKNIGLGPTVRNNRGGGQPTTLATATHYTVTNFEQQPAGGEKPTWRESCGGAETKGVTRGKGKGRTSIGGAYSSVSRFRRTTLRGKESALHSGHASPGCRTSMINVRLDCKHTHTHKAIPSDTRMHWEQEIKEKQARNTTGRGRGRGEGDDEMEQGGLGGPHHHVQLLQGGRGGRVSDGLQGQRLHRVEHSQAAIFDGVVLQQRRRKNKRSDVAEARGGAN
jgi:hypothetical protein